MATVPYVQVLSNPTALRTPAVDVYAFGVVLLEIMTGRRAFAGMSSSAIRDMVVAGGRPALPDESELKSSLRDLVAACWAQVRSKHVLHSSPLLVIVFAGDGVRCFLHCRPSTARSPISPMNAHGPSRSCLQDPEARPGFATITTLLEDALAEAKDGWNTTTTAMALSGGASGTSHW
jgi:serine/threonine protein kinase